MSASCHTSAAFQPEWIWNKIPDVVRDRIVQLALDQLDLSHYGLKSHIGPCPKKRSKTVLTPLKWDVRIIPENGGLANAHGDRNARHFALIKHD
jgi:hypothetical protein